DQGPPRAPCSDGLPAPQGALDPAPRLALGHVAALVVLLLAAGHAQLHLDPRALEVDPQRDQRVAPLPHPARPVVDLPAVQQQLAPSGGLVVPAVAVLVGRDVHVVEPDLTALHPGVGVGQVDAARPGRLGLGARQGDARLHRFLDVVFVVGLTIAGQQPPSHRPSPPPPGPAAPPAAAAGPVTIPETVFILALDQFEVQPALQGVDPHQTHADRVAQPEDPAPPLAHQRVAALIEM